MTDHRRAAETLIDLASRWADGGGPAEALAAAQVHATLAVADQLANVRGPRFRRVPESSDIRSLLIVIMDNDADDEPEVLLSWAESEIRKLYE